MRYVVTEIEGYNKVACSSASRVGLSCMVIDTATNRRIVTTFRTEDLGHGGRSWLPRPSQEQRFETVRKQAATRCDLLSRLDEIARQAQGAVA